MKSLEKGPAATSTTPGPRWTATMSARWPLMLGMVNLVLALVVTGLAEPWIGMFLLLAAIAVTTFNRIRVTADHTGLTVRYGFLGWPAHRFPSTASPPPEPSRSAPPNGAAGVTEATSPS